MSRLVNAANDDIDVGMSERDYDKCVLAAQLVVTMVHDTAIDTGNSYAARMVMWVMAVRQQFYDDAREYEWEDADWDGAVELLAKHLRARRIEEL